LIVLTLGYFAIRQTSSFLSQPVPDYSKLTDPADAHAPTDPTTAQHHRAHVEAATPMPKPIVLPGMPPVKAVAGAHVAPQANTSPNLITLPGMSDLSPHQASLASLAVAVPAQIQFQKATPHPAGSPRL
jgi:hypothetical protein